MGKNKGKKKKRQKVVAQTAVSSSREGAEKQEIQTEKKAFPKKILVAAVIFLGVLVCALVLWIDNCETSSQS